MEAFIVENMKTMPLSVANIAHGTWLWVLHADKRPPHIGISCDGYFFSLKFQGKDEFFPIEQLMELIKRKKMPTLVYAINSPLEVDALETAFKQFGQTVPGAVTCLHPIREALGVEHVRLLKELLNALTEQGRLGIAYGMNLPSDFTGTPDYDEQTVHDRLKILLDGK